MKYRLLEFLRQPGDGSEFDLEVFESQDLERAVDIDSVKCSNWCHKAQKNIDSITPDDCEKCFNHDIIAGKLTARSNGAEYPIVAGVPRILPAELLQERLHKKHADFLTKYGGNFKEEERFSYRIEE